MRGRQYIEKYYSLSAFAARLQSAYEDLGLAEGARTHDPLLSVHDNLCESARSAA
jgi:hypothetical protein